MAQRVRQQRPQLRAGSVVSILGSVIAAAVGASLAAVVVDPERRTVAAFVGALLGSVALYTVEAAAAAKSAVAAGPGIPLNARARIVAPMRPGAA